MYVSTYAEICVKKAFVTEQKDCHLQHNLMWFSFHPLQTMIANTLCISPSLSHSLHLSLSLSLYIYIYIYHHIMFTVYVDTRVYRHTYIYIVISLYIYIYRCTCIYRHIICTVISSCHHITCDTHIYIYI